MLPPPPHKAVEFNFSALWLKWLVALGVGHGEISPGGLLLFKRCVRGALLLGLLFSCLTGFGQTTPPDDDDEDDGDDTEYFFPPTRYDTLPEFPTCVPRRFAAPSSIVWFTDYAKVTLRFGPEVEGDAAPVLYREILAYGTGNALLVSALPGEVVHLNLPLNREYELLTTNTCDDTVALVRFSTKMEYYDVISVSREIFEAVMAWNKNYENRDIYALMSDLNEIEVHKRVAFLQQFLRAEPLSPLYDGVFPPRSAFVPTIAWEPEQDCQCRVMRVAAGRSLEPHGGIKDGFIYPKYAVEAYMHRFPGNRGKIWADYSYIGPSRFRQLSGETRRCRNQPEGRTWSGERMTAGRDSIVFMFWAELRFGQACHDNYWHPKNCSCTQEINLEWQYNSKVSAMSVIPDRRACFNGGKSALAVVDDACLVSIARLNSPGPEIIRFVDFARASVTSECHRDFDERRLDDLFSIGYGVYLHLTGPPLTTGYSLPDSLIKAIWTLYYKDIIVSSLNNLLTKPWTIERGSCKEVVDYVNLSRKGRIETLTGPDQFSVIMSAATYMEVEGEAHWKAVARLISGFRLSGVLMEKYPEPGREYCCTRSYGSYLLHSMFRETDEGSTTSSYQNAVGVHFNNARANFHGFLPYNSSTGGFFITNEIGEVYGKSIPNCNTIINGRGYVSSPKADEATPPVVVLRGRDLWLLRPITEVGADDFGYRIFDLQGRVLKEGVGRGNEVLLHRFATTVSSGIYLIGIQDKQTFRTYKIFVP